MSYIIILPTDQEDELYVNLSSQERAQAITRALYNIAVPGNTEGAIFGVVAHPDGEQFALHVIESWVIPCSDHADMSNFRMAYPEVPVEELDAMEALVQGSRKVTYSQLIPSTDIVRDRAYMEEHGWFPTEEE